jgi:hypothetical protein
VYSVFITTNIAVALFCGVVENTTFCDKLKANMLNVPTTEIMEGELNLISVDGHTFTLHKNIVKPFSANITSEERIFIYHLSRASCTVVNDLSNLGTQFRVSQRNEHETRKN